MTNSFAAGFSWIALHWWVVLIACATGIAATCRWGLETENAKVQRAERNRKKELRTLANRISTYGRKVHQRYPTPIFCRLTTYSAMTDARMAANSDSRTVGQW